MFHINDLIIYGSSGICRIEAIGTPGIDGIDANKQYYILVPINSKRSVIYTPVDNQKVTMRSIISYERAQELIDSIPLIPTIEICNSKFTDEKYKNAINSQDCEELIKVIKTIYIKQHDKNNEGKKPSQMDERYMRQAEDLLYSELAIVLDMPKDKMKNYIELRVLQ